MTTTFSAPDLCRCNRTAKTDGVWLLDYRTGRLLGSLIDRNNGKIVSWAEVDLVSEFGLTPRADVHFLPP